MAKRDVELLAPVVAAGADSAGADSAWPVRGGTACWACHVGFPPSTIFPFTPPERMGIRNLFEFQTLMYRPLYWLGRDGQPGVDYDLSLAYPPEWSGDGLSVTVTLKPWKWSNGETICADNVMFWINMMVVKASRYGGYSPGYLPDNLTSCQKVAEDKVRFDFDRAYSKTWVLMNQLTLITPMPRAWDRTAHDAPANASADLADIPAVYDYLVAQNGQWTQESNEFRTTWPSSQSLRGTSEQIIGVAPLALTSATYLRRYQPKVCTTSCFLVMGLSISRVSSPVPRSEPRARWVSSRGPGSLWPNCMITKSPGLIAPSTWSQSPSVRKVRLLRPPSAWFSTRILFVSKCVPMTSPQPRSVFCRL